MLNGLALGRAGFPAGGEHQPVGRGETCALQPSLPILSVIKSQARTPAGLFAGSAAAVTVTHLICREGRGWHTLTSPSAILLFPTAFLTPETTPFFFP